ncbi:MAG: 2Fe-2S iron-sulfur cluster-binding protein [Pseudomonadota bacterium]|nr:2Fe-2S iron-sulfur cluster-binding protein [Pseudomonadota bacterium]
MGRIVVTDRAGKEHELVIEAGENLMEQLRELDDGVEALCGGMCSCATCHVFVGSEWFALLNKPDNDELELLEETESFRQDQSRLSCQVDFTDQLEGMCLTIAPEE